jgi:cell division protein FtsZ
LFNLGNKVGQFVEIKVIGIGGGGGNAVNRMIEAKLQGVNYISANTDAQVLAFSNAEQKIQIGSNITKGLGSGSNPEIGRQAAEENKDKISKALEGAEMVFITAGMGGGTGTGGAPIIAQLSKDLGALTVGVVTKPFSFEGHRRMRQAEEGIKLLKECVDTLIVIPNDRLLQVVDENTSILEAFKIADEVLLHGIQGITAIVIEPGLINVDFADVKMIIKNAGTAIMGLGRASGENRAVKAAQRAINSPILETNIEGAKGILFNISGSSNLSLHEVNKAAEIISKAANPEANIIFGAVINKELNDEVKITVIAAGFETSEKIREVHKLEEIDLNKEKISYNDLEIPTFLREKK